ncbi:MAG: hypothetical protein AB9856_18750 [Cellulosilyticaceae bacterium]
MGLEELLDFEVAADVQNDWDAYAEEGYSIEDATTQLLQQYEEVLEDDEIPLLYVTLAMIQADLESIDERVKDEILEIIESKTSDEYIAKNKSLKKVFQTLKKKCR